MKNYYTKNVIQFLSLQKDSVCYIYIKDFDKTHNIVPALFDIYMLHNT